MKIRGDLQDRLNDLEWSRFRERVAVFVEENEFPDIANRVNRDELLVKIEEARVLAFKWGLYSEFSVAMYFVLWTELDFDFMSEQDVRNYIFIDDSGVEERLEDLVYVYFDEDEERILLQQLLDEGELDLATEMVREVSFSEDADVRGV